MLIAFLIPNLPFPFIFSTMFYSFLSLMASFH